MKSIQGETEIVKPAVRIRTEAIKKRFVREYVKNGGNGKGAMLAAQPNLKPDSAADKASRILRREDVQLEIQKALNDTAIDYRYVLSTRKKFVEVGARQLEEGKKEKELFVSPSDTHKYLGAIEEILGKLGGEKSSTSGNSLHIHLDAMGHNELLEKRRELLGFFTGITEDVQELKPVDPQDQPSPESQDPQDEPKPSK